MEINTTKGVTRNNLNDLVGLVMKNSLKFIVCTYLVYVLLACNSVPSRSITLEESSEAGSLSLKSTFNSISVYWTIDIQDQTDADLFYRKISSHAWKTAQKMKYETRMFEDLHSNFTNYTKQFRGSVVQLEPNTEYEILAVSKINGIYSKSKISTWSEDFKIKETVYIDHTSDKIMINRSGNSTDGYIVFDGQGQNFNLATNALYNIEIDASYVIIRNFNLTDAKKHSIYIGGKRNTNIIIENNNISQWGSKEENHYSGNNYNSAIANRYNNGYFHSNIIIQDNNIFNPNYTANSWIENPKTGMIDDDSHHPEGPQGITISNTNGSNVIRRNNIYSTNGNYFNDGMGSEGDNFRPYGFPGPDSDVYENSISQSRDDAFEIEGGNANVRVWSNFTDKNYVSYGLSPIYIGPLYLFKNVAYRHNYSPNHSNMVGTTFKLQTRPETAGNIFIYHNTQYTNQNELFGANYGLSGSGAEMLNVVAINNAIFVSHEAINGINDSDKFVNNMYSDGTISDESLIESNFQSSQLEIDEYEDIQVSASSNTLSLIKHFKPKLNSALVDKAIHIPNINDNYAGNAPELGANESDALSSVYEHLITLISFDNNTENTSLESLPTSYQGEEIYFSPSINDSTYLEFSEEDVLTAEMKQTDSSDEFTISGWFKTDTDYNDKGMLTGITGKNSYIYLDILADGKLKLGTRPTGSFYQHFTTSKSYNDGDWHHFTVVRGNGQLAIWVDENIDKVVSDRREGNFSFDLFEMKSLDLSAEEIRVYTKDIGTECIKELGRETI
ncbi:LamG domain-containing protein [Pseudoalteromonas sp. SWXJ133]|uniref:LamG-like jellyroll fold domain-containing protein n=1 Tax=Pseudoalteromonas sp. SWXJ133 TaxID=2792069 RepID=UPI0018CC9AB1|nr:LamG-like jellyroll fold domain-containing protein [Pseudoalteromonas sp. SWXJ133]MBH0018992.1 LamG domain-containing protein [Pseudoalteromonas sp. SWXJ133]